MATPAITIPDAAERPTLSVEEAGRLGFGLGRSASYDAARRGDLPTIRIGGRVFVPTAALRRMLQLDERSAGLDERSPGGDAG